MHINVVALALPYRRVIFACRCLPYGASLLSCRIHGVRRRTPEQRIRMQPVDDKCIIKRRGVAVSAST